MKPTAARAAREGSGASDAEPRSVAGRFDTLLTATTTAAPTSATTATTAVTTAARTCATA
jgi:hypothetical protein